jgi:hypothetical protein
MWGPINQDISAEFQSRLLSIMPNYQTLNQGKFSVRDQFEVRFQTHQGLGVGVFMFLVHSCVKLIAIAHQKEHLAEANGDNSGHLFEVTDECIEPVNHSFPRSLRLASRTEKE